jgi:galactonate dehydratase
MHLSGLTFIALRVTPKTVWSFLAVGTSDGGTGIGEATLAGDEDLVAEATAAHFPAIAGTGIDDPEEVFSRLPFGTLPEAAYASALMQALYDLKGQAEGKTVSDLLGGRKRDEVRVYANINRRTIDRTPAGVAASATDAVRAGYTAIKIAPFDGLDPGMPPEEALPMVAAGVERIAALRDAVGPGIPVMVDCHWRFTEDLARHALDRLAGLDLHWFECPLPETQATISAIARLRAAANERGILLAGLEKNILWAGFRPFIEAAAYDVVMPDVQYAGGPAEMLRIGEMLTRNGTVFSPHNPTGPVAHAATLQVCGAASDIGMLETQFDETPLFAALAGNPAAALRDGAMEVPDIPGLGITLDPAIVRSLEITSFWSSGDGAPSFGIAEGTTPARTTRDPGNKAATAS